MTEAMRFERTELTELTDDGLLRRVCAGDEDAFTLLYRRKHPAIYRFALHMAGNPAVAEDVTQEVFMALIRDTKRFDPARGTLTSFLFGIARNFLRKRWEQDRRIVALPDNHDEFTHFEARDGLGSRAGQYTGIGPIAAAGRNGNGNALAHPAEQFAAHETVDRVRQAVATLPENYREVVVLCELEEMSYDDAAATLDCPVGTVRSRLHRARALLIEKLRDLQPMGRPAAVRE
jgi:RNA polymerase sigma-70 factor, ECF subfamily